MAENILEARAEFNKVIDFVIMKLRRSKLLMFVPIIAIFRQLSVIGTARRSAAISFYTDSVPVGQKLRKKVVGCPTGF